MTYKVLFYSDTTEFGGHEILSIDAAKFLLCNGYNISYICCSENIKIIKALEKLQEIGLEIYKFTHKSKFLPSIKSLISFRSQRNLKILKTSINPDLVIAVQGRIESSSMPLVISRSFECPVGSYLPLPHSVKVISQWPGSKARDLLNKFYYQKSNFFIVPSNAMKSELDQRVKNKRIFIVNNGIDFSKYKKINKDEAKRALGFASSDFLISMIGRVQFRHKNQPFVLRNIAKLVELIPNLKLLIAGSGPNKIQLKKLIYPTYQQYVTYLPWVEDVSTIFSATDMLISASRFEGFPVVANEGMYYKIPVVAPNIPEMSEFLPKEWLFEAENDMDFVSTVFKVKKSPNQNRIDSNYEKTISNFSLDSFGESFKGAIESIILNN
jgi:glycosyltransferase involved in cell wall biosynthesis